MGTRSLRPAYGHGLDTYNVRPLSVMAIAATVAAAGISVALGLAGKARRRPDKGSTIKAAPPELSSLTANEGSITDVQVSSPSLEPPDASWAAQFNKPWFSSLRGVRIYQATANASTLPLTEEAAPGDDTCDLDKNTQHMDLEGKQCIQVSSAPHPSHAPHQQLLPPEPQSPIDEVEVIVDYLAKQLDANPDASCSHLEVESMHVCVMPPELPPHDNDAPDTAAAERLLVYAISACKATDLECTADGPTLAARDDTIMNTSLPSAPQAPVPECSCVLTEVAYALANSDSGVSVEASSSSSSYSEDPQSPDEAIDEVAECAFGHEGERRAALEENEAEEADVFDTAVRNAEAADTLPASGDEAVAAAAAEAVVTDSTVDDFVTTIIWAALAEVYHASPTTAETAVCEIGSSKLTDPSTDADSCTHPAVVATEEVVVAVDPVATTIDLQVAAEAATEATEEEVVNTTTTSASDIAAAAEPVVVVVMVVGADQSVFLTVLCKTAAALPVSSDGVREVAAAASAPELPTVSLSAAVTSGAAQEVSEPGPTAVDVTAAERATHEAAAEAEDTTSTTPTAETSPLPQLPQQAAACEPPDALLHGPSEGISDTPEVEPPRPLCAAASTATSGPLNDITNMVAREEPGAAAAGPAEVVATTGAAKVADDNDEPGAGGSLSPCPSLHSGGTWMSYSEDTPLGDAAAVLDHHEAPPPPPEDERFASEDGSVVPYQTDDGLAATAQQHEGTAVEEREEGKEEVKVEEGDEGNGEEEVLLQAATEAALGATPALTDSDLHPQVVHQGDDIETQLHEDEEWDGGLSSAAGATTASACTTGPWDITEQDEQEGEGTAVTVTMGNPLFVLENGNVTTPYTSAVANPCFVSSHGAFGSPIGPIHPSSPPRGPSASGSRDYEERNKPPVAAALPSKGAPYDINGFNVTSPTSSDSVAASGRVQLTSPPPLPTTPIRSPPSPAAPPSLAAPHTPCATSASAPLPPDGSKGFARPASPRSLANAFALQAVHSHSHSLPGSRLAVVSSTAPSATPATGPSSESPVVGIRASSTTSISSHRGKRPVTSPSSAAASRAPSYVRAPLPTSPISTPTSTAATATAAVTPSRTLGRPVSPSAPPASRSNRQPTATIASLAGPPPAGAATASRTFMSPRASRDANTSSSVQPAPPPLQLPSRPPFRPTSKKPATSAVRFPSPPAVAVFVAAAGSPCAAEPGARQKAPLAAEWRALPRFMRPTRAFLAASTAISNGGASGGAGKQEGEGGDRGKEGVGAAEGEATRGKPAAALVCPRPRWR